MIAVGRQSGSAKLADPLANSGGGGGGLFELAHLGEQVVCLQLFELQPSAPQTNLIYSAELLKLLNGQLICSQLNH